MPNAPFPTSAPLPPEQMVSASDLVRHFGEWQERASRAPVYILHRGRPRMVLTTIDLMEALCAPRPPAVAGGTMLDPVFDTVRVALFVVDHRTVVVAASRAAAVLTGQDLADIVGRPLGDVWRDDSGRIGTLVARVLAASQPDTLLLTGARGDRQMLVAIDPLPRGALLTVRDVTVEEEHEDLSAERIATERAMGASRATSARINARGRIEAPDPALTALSGIDRHALSGVRFAQLFDVASRMAVGDAIEQCFADGAPRTVPATLVVNRGGMIPVTLGFGAVHRARRVEALVALLYPRAEIPPA